MRSALYLTTAIPTTTLPDSTVVPDDRYWVWLRIPGAVAIYGLRYVVHAQPGAPVPPNTVQTLQDGTTDWSWTDGSLLLKTNAVGAPYMAAALWKQVDGTHYGAMADYNAAVATLAVTQTFVTNQPCHGWYGDGL